MIFSMKKKFDENGIYWDYSEGGWLKSILGLNKSKKNGFSLIGDFIASGVNRNDYEPGLYLNCNKFDGHIVYQLVKLYDNGALELLQELVDPPKGWAVELWESIDANLEESPLSPTYPDKFLNFLHFKAYMEYVNIIEVFKDILESYLQKTDFSLPRALHSDEEYIGAVCNVLFKDCELDSISEIENPQNLLNLTYLETLRGDKGAFLRIEHKIVIFYAQGGKLYIKWMVMV